MGINENFLTYANKVMENYAKMEGSAYDIQKILISY